MLIDFTLCTEIIERVHGTKVRKIYHIGAHEGEEVNIYAQNMVTHVIWFEANMSLIKKLKTHIDNFKMTQSIVPCALWDEDTYLDFHVTNNPQSSSFFELSKHSDYYPGITVDKIEKIKTYRLDTLIKSSPRILPWEDFDFLNIDTQGAELSILKGLGSFIDSECLKGIYLEINSETLYKNIPLVSEIDAFLMAHGFFRVLTKWWANHGWGDGFYLKARTF
jgi:FkbM family methyltransferase